VITTLVPADPLLGARVSIAGKSVQLLEISERCGFGRSTGAWVSDRRIFTINAIDQIRFSSTTMDLRFPLPTCPSLCICVTYPHLNRALD